MKEEVKVEVRRFTCRAYAGPYRRLILQVGPPPAAAATECREESRDMELLARGSRVLRLRLCAS